MIKLIVNNQELSIVTQKVVSGTHDYLTVEADFKGETWEDLRKWVHFTMGSFNYVLPMTDDKITADMHLDLTEGTWQVYVHGNLVSDNEVTERITTDIKYLYVDAPHDGHPFPPLTPDFEELLANQVAEANEMSARIWGLYLDGELIDGATFYPSVNEEGVISWTNDKDKQNPAPVNIRGPQGENGKSGVYIGTPAPTDPDVNVWINPSGGAGKLITKVETTGTHAPGTTDTYTLTFDDTSTLVITVYNGANGEGAGDMVMSVYDTHGKQQDIFDYADAIKDKTAQTGLLKGSSGSIVPAVANTDYVDPAYLSTVAHSGSYNDLSNKPTIPAAVTVDPALSIESTNPVQNKVVKQAIDAIQTRPNPYALTIEVNGSTVTYDGSAARNFFIPTSGGGGDTIATRLIELPTVTVAANAEEVAIFNYEYSGYTVVAIVEVKLTYGNNLVPVFWGKVTSENGQIRVWNKGSSSYSGKPGYVRVLYKKNS